MFKISNVIFLISFISGASAQAGIYGELGGALHSGGAMIKEIYPTYTMNHSETLLSLGLEVNTRVGFQFDSVFLGAAGFLTYEASLLNYQPSNGSITSSGTYSVTNRRAGVGPSLKFLLGEKLSIVAEWYPSVTNYINWAESKSQDPFRKDDWLAGWGLGGGISATVSQHVQFYALLRWMVYTKASINGVASDIPGSKFDTANLLSGVVGLAYSF